MIRFNHPFDIMALSGTIDMRFNDAVDQCIARVEGAHLMGGTLYNNYTGASICIHMVGFDPHWVNRDMLWAAFHYPFVQLGCKKLIGQVCSTNQRSLQTTRKLGFKDEAVITDVYPEGDMIVLSMLREDCRWLSVRPRTIQSNSELIAAE